LRDTLKIQKHQIKGKDGSIRVQLFINLPRQVVALMDLKPGDELLHYFNQKGELWLRKAGE